MELYCTRPGCSRPVNGFPDLDDPAVLKTVTQKYCTTCGMQLILLGRYLPQQLLGQGGFGAAFLARDRYTPKMRQCVVKQFLPSGKLNPAQLQVAQELFEREAEVLENIGNVHPQIPDLFAFFELSVPGSPAGRIDKFFYLVQEFIDGQTMEAELEQKGVFAAAEVTEMLQAVLPVLAFVHEKGLIHRDIKPSNIMRHRNGLFYLLDFGAVKQATKGGVPSSHSTGIYSLGFAPPEQVAGNEVYPASDLYALAVTAIMLLTGKLPHELFDGSSNSWKWHDLAPQVGNPLGEVLDRLLLPASNHRFQTATEVLAALERPPSISSVGSVPSPSTRQGAAGTHSGTRPLQVPPTTLPTHPTPPPQPSAVTPVQFRPSGITSTSFSTLELIGAAAFTGFEAGLLAIALLSTLGTSLISTFFWVLLLAGLVISQSRRVIERIDLVIIATVTLGAVLLFSPLRRIVALANVGNPFLAVVFVAIGSGLLAIAAFTLFRLVYHLLSSIV